MLKQVSASSDDGIALHIIFAVFRSVRAVITASSMDCWLVYAVFLQSIAQ